MPSAVRWVARFVAVTGVIDVLTALAPPGWRRLRLLTEVVPLTGVQTARAVTVAVGLVLIYLSVGLRRRTAEAWTLAVVLASASVVLNVVKGLDLDAAAVSGVLLALLVKSRADFRATRPWTSHWRILTAFVGFAVAGLAIGVAEIGVRAQALAPGQPWRLWLVQSAEGMVGVTGPLRFTRPAVADAVSVTTGVLGLLALGVPLVMLLKPRGRRPGHTGADRERIGRLLATHGAQDSLGYFALRADKSMVWSSSGKAGVAYRVIWGVSLASGDPLGDPEAWPGAVEAWLTDCRAHGWTPAVLGCGERAAHLYAKHGLDAIELGDEALVDTAAFSLAGRSMRAVRQAVGRVERAGYTCQVDRQRDLDPVALAEARRAWGSLRDGEVERGFSMALSRVGDPADPDCVLVLARDAAGTLRGLLQFVPWGPDGLSLDVMRRDRSSDNGLIEYMITNVIRQAADLGVRRLSLNFAVLRSVFARGDRIGAGPVLRAWYQVLLLASRYWQLESLYRANAKYLPVWLPRFLCFPSLADIPRIGLVALRAEAFLTAPALLRRAAPVRRPSTVVPEPAGTP